MKDLNQNLLNSIDLIQEATVESELNVCNALITEYFKQADILAYADESVVNEFAIIQESFFTEAETKAIEDKSAPKKKELLIVRIFRAIGEAISKAWKWITEKISKAWNWLKEKFSKKKDIQPTPEVIKGIEGQVAEQENLKKVEVLAVTQVTTAATELETFINDFIKLYNDGNNSPDGTLKKRLANIKRMFGNVEYETLVNSDEGLKEFLIAPMTQGNYSGQSRIELAKKLCETGNKLGEIIKNNFGEAKPITLSDKDAEASINSWIEDAKVIQAVVADLNKCGAEISKTYTTIIFGNVKEGN